MQVDYMKLLQAIRSGANPQQLVMSVLEGKMANTPMGKNLLQLVKENKTSFYWLLLHWFAFDRNFRLLD